MHKRTHQLIRSTRPFLTAVVGSAVMAALACAPVAGAAGRPAGNLAVSGVADNEPVTQTLVVPVAGPNGTIQVQVAITCGDVVVNGNFEAPSPGRPWAGVANTPSRIYNDPFVSNVRAHNGAQSGRVGSPTINSYWNEMIQTVQLPNGVSSVTLTYWRYLDTAETSRTKAYDTFSIGLETEQGIQIVQPQRVTNMSSGRSTWVKETLALPSASAYSGQRLWVTFKGTTDSNRPSSLYVDDVQLMVCALNG